MVLRRAVCRVFARSHVRGFCGTPVAGFRATSCVLTDDRIGGGGDVESDFWDPTADEQPAAAATQLSKEAELVQHLEYLEEELRECGGQMQARRGVQIQIEETEKELAALRAEKTK
eukprot:TRINITY_DN48157_c0_g1_i1.p1 TRINITY_DN48157_c0_g1~~TRINITY_DN48157_c0_g1_i1.p1  ORF type:complete len:116 (+),score=29.54 TRINITY_DN48157_c0_g1_i1:66-413(+)